MAPRGKWPQTHIKKPEKDSGQGKAKEKTFCGEKKRERGKLGNTHSGVYPQKKKLLGGPL